MKFLFPSLFDPSSSGPVGSPRPALGELEKHVFETLRFGANRLADPVGGDRGQMDYHLVATSRVSQLPAGPKGVAFYEAGSSVIVFTMTRLSLPSCVVSRA